MNSTVLSPIALACREEVLAALSEARPERIDQVCYELLDVNTRDLAPGAANVTACVAAVMEGVLAALAATRSSTIEAAMHGVAKYAAQRDGADAVSVATIIKDAASVIEIAETNPDLEIAINAALTACDRLLGPDRDGVILFLRDVLANPNPTTETNASAPEGLL